MISEKMTYTFALRRFLEGKEEKPSRKKQRAKKEKKEKRMKAVECICKNTPMFYVNAIY